MSEQQNDDLIRDDATAREEQRRKRPTVIVSCALDRGVQIAHHQVHQGFMGAETRVPHGDIVTLKQGDNYDIDKEWFEQWLEENPELSLVKGGQISWRDGEPKAADEPPPRGGVDAQPQSQPDSIKEMRQTGDRPLLEPDPTAEKPAE